MALAWTGGTPETYGSGLLAFHVFCDREMVPEDARAPVATEILLAFVAAMAGAYSSSTIRNYYCGVRAWHILHGMPWRVDGLRLEAAIKGASQLVPNISRRKARQPYTLVFLSAVRAHLDLQSPAHLAVFACLTTTFFSIARLGEFTVKSLLAFKSASHISRGGMRTELDKKGGFTTVFHLPKTKTSLVGEDVFWARQSGDWDPDAALRAHLQVNATLDENPNLTALFAYRHLGSLRPLTKKFFLDTVSQAARSAGMEALQGHGIRIGGTLEYLLRGVPFETVKAMGRWRSDSFLLYLRKHAQVISPYIQANAGVHASLMHLLLQTNGESAPRHVGHELALLCVAGS